MLYGEQNISSKWYFFNTTDGNVAKVGISYRMDAKSTMTLTTMVMVKVCCMACKKWETITTISI